MKTINPLLLTDGYKASHSALFPKNTSLIYSNMTPRKSRIEEIEDVVVFGIQYFVKEYLIRRFNEDFFSQPREKVVASYKRILDNYFGKDVIDTTNIGELWDLQYVPIRLKALPEGSSCPLGCPFLTIVNTHPKFYWLTNFIETIMSSMLWMPITTATIARQYRRILNKYALETVGNTDFVQWQGHDFSARGLTSIDSVMVSGGAHLLSFTGSDSLPAIVWLEEYYNADCENEIVAKSVRATEHMLMTLGGPENEAKTYLRLITENCPDGIVAIVSDTYNLWNVLTNILPSLKNEIMNRDGTLTIRPDSGSPVHIVCGYTQDEMDNMTEELKKEFEREGNWEAKRKGLIEVLWETFGGTVNSLGYKELDSHVKGIYGDGISLERSEEICSRLKNKGFASTNVLYGIGSVSYQLRTRDTFNQAVKATAAIVDGEFKAMFKDPITSDGMKKSAKGLLRVDLVDGKYNCKDNQDWESENGGELRTVFENGKIIIEDNLSEIRRRVNA